MGALHRPKQAPHRGHDCYRPRAGGLVLVTGGHGRLTFTDCFAAPTGAGGSAWSNPRNSYEQVRATRATLEPRQANPAPAEPPSCGNQPAHISLTARRKRHAHQHRPAAKHEAPATGKPG